MTSSEMQNPLLEVRDAVVHYGRIEALHGVSLTVREGELVTLLGPNGAGKTTLMRALSGLRPLTSGSVWFDGRDITRVKGHRRVVEGLVQAPEGRGVFPGMTVTENLEMGCYGRKFESKAAHDERLDWVLTTFPRLAERRKQVGGTLSGGEQQMLSVARTLLGKPRLLLLDEPLEGLAPIICQELMQCFKMLAQESGVAIILVEQKVDDALKFAQDAVVFERGQVVHRESCATLRGRHDVLAGLVGVAGD